MSQPFLQTYAGKEKSWRRGFFVTSALPSTFRLNNYSNIIIIASTIDPHFFQMPFKHRNTKLGY